MIRFLAILFGFFYIQSSVAQVFYSSQASEIVPNASLVKLDEKTKNIEFIQFQTGNELQSTKLESYLTNLLRYGEPTKIELINSYTDQLGQVHNRYRLIYNGLEVHEGMFVSHERNGKIFSIGGNFPTSLKPVNQLVLTENEALQRALTYVDAETYMWQIPVEEDFIKLQTGDTAASWFPKGTLKLKYQTESEGFNYAYVFDIYAHKPVSRAEYYVDATDGSILFVNKIIKHIDSVGSANTKFSGVKTITADFHNNSFRLRESGRGNGVQTFNMQTGTTYGGAVDFTDADNYWNNYNAQKDEVATDAHWGMEMTYDYYFTRYSRNSIDGNGFLLKSYVHYDVNYANAFWNGQYMTFGDGNSSWQPLVALDIVAHEISHGLTSFTADLDYQDESGAMNESYSDIFGTAIEHFGKPASGNWLIGEDIGTAMRSMSNPKSKGDPDTYLGQYYYIGAADNGGVHTNSGVLNHWFYLLSEGGQGINDNSDTFDVSGIGIDTAGAIAFRALTVYLVNTSDFAECRFYSILAAQDLYGACSDAVKATTSAFYAIGVGPDYVEGVQSDFSTPLTSFCAPPATVAFSNGSNNGQSFVWNFGDGNSSTSLNPTHTYNSYGSFTVSLIANGGSCGSDTLAKVAYISVDTANPCLNMMPSSGLTTLTSCNGVIMDDGGAAPYSANTNSMIVINPVGASQVKLTFTQFDFESGYDYLRIYDGPSVQSPLIGSYDGNTLPNGGIIFSSGSSITLLQSTDQAVNNEGFVANYECILPSVAPLSDFKVSDSISCSGQILFKDLSTNGPTAWEWDFGDGNTSTQQNPVHNYTQNGSYSVSLKSTNLIGNHTVTKVGVVQIERLFLPAIPSKSVCNSGDVDLIVFAKNTGSKINWYSSSASTNPIHVGDTLTLTNLTNSITYYAEQEREKPMLSAGKASNAGGGGNLTYTQGLYFDAYQPFILHSVNVYTTSAGSRTIVLKNAIGMTIATKTFQAVTGLNTVVLDFNVPAANGLLLEGSNFYRNNNGVNYPYNLTDYLSIYKSSAGTDPLSFYYYFYDWKIKQPSCFSDRVAVNAFVNNAAPVADFSVVMADPYVDFMDISQNKGAAFWNFGDGQTSMLSNPEHLYLQNGNYQVMLKVDNGCGMDSISKNVSINLATSLENVVQKNAISVYPNPASDHFFIETSLESYEFSLLDYTGKMVKREIIIHNPSYSVDATDLSAGMYLVKIVADNQIYTFKMMLNINGK